MPTAKEKELNEMATTMSAKDTCKKQSHPEGREKLTDVDKEETTTPGWLSPMAGEYFQCQAI